GAVLTTLLAEAHLAIALALSAGVTVYVAASDLIPEVNREGSAALAWTVFAGLVLFAAADWTLGEFGGGHRPRCILPDVKRLLVLHGPNLNLLGTREPEVYGAVSLPDVDRALREHGRRRGVIIDCRQSNLEGELVTWLQGAEREGYGGVVFNPGAFTHYSIA